MGKVLILLAYLSAAAAMDGQNLVSTDEVGEKRIDRSEAEQLALEVLRPSLGAVSLESCALSKYSPEMYCFTAVWPNPKGSPIVGYYAVNPRTADVWNARSCEHITSPSLERKQEALRKRFKYSRQEFKRLELLKPLCITAREQ